MVYFRGRRINCNTVADNIAFVGGGVADLVVSGPGAITGGKGVFGRRQVSYPTGRIIGKAGVLGDPHGDRVGTYPERFQRYRQIAGIGRAPITAILQKDTADRRRSSIYQYAVANDIAFIGADVPRFKIRGPRAVTGGKGIFGRRGIGDPPGRVLRKSGILRDVHRRRLTGHAKHFQGDSQLVGNNLAGSDPVGQYDETDLRRSARVDRKVRPAHVAGKEADLVDRFNTDTGAGTADGWDRPDVTSVIRLLAGNQGPAFAGIERIAESDRAGAKANFVGRDPGDLIGRAAGQVFTTAGQDKGDFRCCGID